MTFIHYWDYKYLNKILKQNETKKSNKGGEDSKTKRQKRVSNN